MTRTPAPTDHPAMDLALREAAEEWRTDFEVPPMPLLESDSQPLEAAAPARLRWTRPVLVAASIVALGGLTAAVISVARPADRVASPPPSAAPTTSSSTVLDENVWPTVNAGNLVIAEGAPPPTITLGGVVLTLGSTGSPTSLIIDSDHPEFFSVAGQSVLRSCHYVTRIFLDRTAWNVVTVTDAKYHLKVDGPQLCLAMAFGDDQLQGTAPFAIADLALLAPGSRTPLRHVDLAGYRAPRYVPTGYALGSAFMVAPAWASSPFGSQVNRVLRADNKRLRADIWLTWRDPDRGRTAAPEPSVATQVIHCATRDLTASLAVTACSNTVDPQQQVSTAELQRVVDSIPG